MLPAHAVLPAHPITYIGHELTGIALTLPRIVGAFLVLPLMTSKTMPALVRNSFYVSLAILIYPLASAIQPYSVIGDKATWLMIMGKEFFIGLALGFCFGLVFWALASAGAVLDTKVGYAFAKEMDPVYGQSTTLTSSFLMQLGVWLFMTSGAFIIFLDLLMSSYAVWPVASMLPPLQPESLDFFVGQFSYFMSAVLVLSAPGLVVMSLADISLGLINRYAQQLNVFALSLPIKAWMSTWVLLLALGAMVEVVIRRLYENRVLVHALEHVFGS